MNQIFKNIIVTGCNKGLGYGIIENLYQKNYNIIMACRNLDLANAAKLKIEKQFQNLNLSSKLIPMELDISNSKSIDTFVRNFSEKFQKTGILLNNAGIAFKGSQFNEKVVTETLKVNFYGTAELTEKMIPYITNNGKIITIGSSSGKFDKLIFDEKIKQEIKLTLDNFDKVTKKQLIEFSETYLNYTRNGQLQQHGFKEFGYGLSKLLINLYTRVLARQVEPKNIQAYSCCPGWAGHINPPLTIQEGAQTPVFLVELPFQINKQFQGQFFYEKKVTTL